MKALKQSLVVIVSVIILAEICCRLLGWFQTYSERIGQGYTTDYGRVFNTWYHTHIPNQNYPPDNSDFKYPYSINSLGIREKEVTPKKDSTIRILVTGDSFAEGVGAPYDSTWPRMLEKALQQKGIKAEVINAGVAGSDLLYDFVRYRDKLHHLQPDIVITAINSSDYVDLAFRGGLERFHADGTTHNKTAPWYETIYRHSFLLRGIIRLALQYPFEGLHLSGKAYQQHCSRANFLLQNTCKIYKDEAEKHGAKFYAVIHVMPTEIHSEDNKIHLQDVRHLDSLAATLKQENINCINLINPLKQQLGSLKPEAITYPNDKHFNPYGYAVMGQLIAERLP